MYERTIIKPFRSNDALCMPTDDLTTFYVQFFMLLKWDLPRCICLLMNRSSVLWPRVFAQLQSILILKFNDETPQVVKALDMTDSQPRLLKLLVNLYVNRCLISVILHLLLAVFQID